jgi:alpha-tubulin suppressor-like RCC1 family protein
VLTNCGEVYAWGYNYWGRIGNGCNSNQSIPIKVKGFNNERVVMISCGCFHSMALTECGHVYSWGYNKFGQLGIGNTVDSNEPKFFAVIDENKCNVFIEKISCGEFHSLLLSSDGFIYAFGHNSDGKLGNELSPQRIKIETKFIDISSHWRKDISIALSQEGIYYNWGQCGEKIIRTPKPTNFEYFVEIYAKYFKITNKAINFEDQNSVPTLKAIKNEAASDFSFFVLSGSSAMAPAVEQITNSVPVLLREEENILKTQIRLEEENGEKVKANKTEYIRVS